MPVQTITLLNRLTAAGFIDDDFRIIHHMPTNTIRAHIEYCSRTGEFRDQASTNAKVRVRLELIADAYFGAGFTQPAHPGVFAALARAALAENPMS